MSHLWVWHQPLAASLQCRFSSLISYKWSWEERQEHWSNCPFVLASMPACRWDFTGVKGKPLLLNASKIHSIFIKSQNRSIHKGSQDTSSPSSCSKWGWHWIQTRFLRMCPWIPPRLETLWAPLAWQGASVRVKTAFLKASQALPPQFTPTASPSPC